MTQSFRAMALYLALIVVMVGVGGSLYASEVGGLIPCVLCWYQRIAFYPLLIILPVGIALKDPRLFNYAIALPVIGGAIALYHVLLTWGIVPAAAELCRAGVSCAQITWSFGFVTIPLLSLTAFVLIIILLFISRSYVKRN